MNAHACISDQHSITYHFEDVRPTIGGVRLDNGFFGAAELSADPGYTFYVRSIVLNGTVPDKLARPTLFGGRPRKSVVAVLTRPAKDDTSPEAVLFRLIEDAIYEDSDAAEVWQAEVEAA